MPYHIAPPASVPLHHIKADPKASDPWAMSPFRRHADKLTGNYSTAIRLQNLVLHLYNGEDWPVRLDNLLANADEAHVQAALEMIASYARHVENDLAFMEVARRIAEQRLANRGDL